MYPDRLIRPLPRRTLRSRLSQDAAEKIDFPPSVPSTTLSSYGHYGENGDFLDNGKILVHQDRDIYDHDHEHDPDFDDDHDEDHCPHRHHHCPHQDDDDLDSSEDISPALVRRTSGYRSSPRSPRSTRYARHGSTTKLSPSGMDGYDAFENTNNKKKRKIPTSGGMNFHHSSLSSDLAHMSISTTQDGANSDVGQHYASTASTGLGMPVTGRGRSSRKLSNRNPLGLSVNGSNLRTTSKSDQGTDPMKGTCKPDLLASL